MKKFNIVIVDSRMNLVQNQSQQIPGQSAITVMLDNGIYNYVLFANTESGVIQRTYP